MTFDDEDVDEKALEAHEYRIKRCRAPECRARIIWLSTGTNKPMPVDADSVAVGDTVFDSDRHESHFATCPASQKFRRPR